MTKLLLLSLVAGSIIFGIAVGFFTQTSLSSDSSTTTSTQGPSGQLLLVAAGTLNTLFPKVASQLSAVYPNVQVSNATQEYMGSLDAVRQIVSLHGEFDLIATVDPRQIPTYMYPTYSNWQACFASNAVALVYSPQSRFAETINSSNWASIILQKGVVVGAANASTDANGYNAIFALELAGIKLYGNATYLYDHFYTNGTNGVAGPNLNTKAIRIAPETTTEALLTSGAVDFYFTYVSYAVANHLDYINLGPWTNLGEFNSTYWNFYKQVHTNIIGANSTIVTVSGAPIVYCATIPNNSPNTTLAEYFLMFLMSPQGQADMQQIGLSAITPAYVDNLSSIPALLTPCSTQMPSELSSAL